MRARIGVTIYSVDYTMRPDDLAREIEARGFESFWVPEHSNIPTSRKSPWPGSLTGEPLPREYSHMLDAFVALSMAAAVTTKLRLGTGVMLPAQRDAIWTSKQISSLDFLSNGRVEVGVGIGWNQDEMESHGAVFRERWDKTREVAEAMRVGLKAVVDLGPERGALRVSAGNYGGQLGPHHYHLKDLAP